MKLEYYQEDTTISTPQFRGGLIDKHHKQNGYIDTKTWLFTPYVKGYGNHTVQFNGELDFKKAISK